MRYLLDTCAFMYLIWDDERLRPTAREILSDTRHEVFLSSVSIWEACLKCGTGKLTLNTPEPPWQFFTRMRDVHEITSLPLLENAVRHLSALPLLHKDPFDRMLVCQAIDASMILVTPDTKLQQYPVTTIW